MRYHKPEQGDASMEKIAEKAGFCIRAAELVREAMEGVFAEVREGNRIREVDVILREEMGRIARELLGMLLSARGGKESYGEEVRCSCGGTAKFKANRKHQVGTVLVGKTVEVEAAYYVCEVCRRGKTPLLEELGTDGDVATVGLQELTVLAGVIAPYEEASGMLSKFAGLSVSGTRIQTRLVEEGEAVQELDMRKCEIRDDTVCVAIDGGMIHVDNRWREVKLAVIYGEDNRVEISRNRRALVSRDVMAVRGGPEDLSAAIECRFPG